MTSTSFNVGLTSGTRNSSKVLKPPGGGSSDIFGTTGSESAEPQRKGKNHLTSSIFVGDETVTPSRNKAGNDSFYNLFGTESQSRPVSAVKDNFKSNIVPDEHSGETHTVDAKKSLVFTEDDLEGEMVNERISTELENINLAETNGETNGNNPLEENNQPTTNGEKAEPAVNGVSSATNSTASTPAPTPMANSAAAARQRVPPGGFSSGLW